MKQKLFDFKSARVLSIRQETPFVNTYTVLINDNISNKIGQFLMLTSPDGGEFPAIGHSIADNNQIIEITVDSNNQFSSSFCKSIQIQDNFILRTGCGRPFSLETVYGSEILIITEKSHISQVKPLIYEILKYKNMFPKIGIKYHTYDSSELVYREEFTHWQAIDNVQLTVALEKPDSKWSGLRGDIMTLLKQNPRVYENTYAFIALEDNSLNNVLDFLLTSGFQNSEIFTYLLNDITCGVGKCSGCNIGPYLVCQDGPIFRYSDICNFMNFRGHKHKTEIAYG